MVIWLITDFTLLFIKNKNMKGFITIFIFIWVSVSFGQTQLRKTCVSSGGGSFVNAGVYMIYTVGEISNREININSTLLSEGFIGPDFATLLGINDYEVMHNVNVFPNPVKDKMQVKLPSINDYKIYLFGLNGKLIFESDITNENQASYHLKDLRAGVYTLVIVNHLQKKSVTIKLLKL